VELRKRKNKKKKKKIRFQRADLVDYVSEMTNETGKRHRFPFRDIIMRLIALVAAVRLPFLTLLRHSAIIE